LLESLVLGTPVDARVIDECAADHESIGKVQTRHGSKLIDILATYPNTLCVLLTDRVVEPERFWQETWWHTGVETEDEESGKVTQCHRTSGHSESGVIRCGIVIPGKETIRGLACTFNE